ncbi:MAG: quinone-dependent dihydroorotate dehydrogenase [Saprospiraceae bacterium]|nr:quinone-dependent dihydroorotate dehydrogenase [Saprospiraceae bacterium]MDW8230598.1 quinone-dependent dihydroorotate dehydrogenase [Saprospiraceae bacterium]
MYALLRPLLFALPPEKAHHTAMALLDGAAALPFLSGALRKAFCLQSSSLERRYMGLTFPNPVGLAAGFDKDGRHLEALACLGFGFLEVGTVTPRPQPGNPRPRLFRLPADSALINRMGFNNDGAQALAQRLRRWREQPHTEPRPIIGVNIGKNKDTPNDRAADDYLSCFHTLAPWADYFAVNVSSPNTPGLRDLQSREPLLQLLQALQDANYRLPSPRPLLLKIAPDMDAEHLDEIANIAHQTQLAGLIATNTTLSRAGLRTDAQRLEAIGPGGLSGAPLRQRSTEVIQHLRHRLGPETVLIGVGGIDSPQAAREKLQAGAHLVQVYTGLIYQGPGLVRSILEGMK